MILKVQVFELPKRRLDWEFPSNQWVLWLFFHSSEGQDLARWVTWGPVLALRMAPSRKLAARPAWADKEGAGAAVRRWIDRWHLLILIKVTTHGQKAPARLGMITISPVSVFVNIPEKVMALVVEKGSPQEYSRKEHGESCKCLSPEETMLWVSC